MADATPAAAGATAAAPATAPSKPRPRTRKKRSKGHFRIHVKDGIPLQFSQKEAGKYSVYGQLKMSNPTSQTLAFKIRTTTPDRYHVKPNAGLVQSDSVANITIMVPPAEAAKLVSTISSGTSNLKDRFQVRSIALSPEQEEQLSAAPKEDQLRQLELMWEAASNPGKIAIAVQCPSAEELETMLVGAPAAPAKRSPATTYEAASAPAPAAPAPAPATAEEPAVAPAVTSTAAPAAASTEAAPELSYEEMMELRERYNELVSYTVNMSARHDELVSLLKTKTMALEAADKRYEDAKQRLEELDSGTRRRVTRPKDGEGGDAAGAGAGAGAGATEPEVAVRVVRTGFPLWQVLLLALVMFFVGSMLASGGPAETAA